MNCTVSIVLNANKKEGFQNPKFLQASYMEALRGKREETKKVPHYHRHEMRTGRVR